MEPRVVQRASSRTTRAQGGRTRATILSLALGGAVALGSYAAVGRLELGPAQQELRASDNAIETRRSELDAFEADLRAALAQEPPALPPIPRYRPVKIPPIPKPRVVQVSYVVTVQEDDKKKDDKKGEKDKKRYEKEKKKHEKEKEKKEKKKDEKDD